ncbi:hypothetical protein [uncultured Clostridium sp.]|uniref:hypothetical protein n=1 Tax=uncultured Clostridium sp. TaxID=59620 RepID=UPI0027DD87A2|nr:hypothetical protein [uncultured Clostridium sp.]
MKDFLMIYVNAAGIFLLIGGCVQVLMSMFGTSTLSKLFKAATKIGVAAVMMNADKIATKIFS